MLALAIRNGSVSARNPSVCAAALYTTGQHRAANHRHRQTDTPKKHFKNKAENGNSELRKKSEEFWGSVPMLLAAFLLPSVSAVCNHSALPCATSCPPHSYRPPLLNTLLSSQRIVFLISLPQHVLPSVSIAAALQRPQPRCCPPSSAGTPTPSPPSHPPSLISPQTSVTCEEWTCSIDGNSVSYEVLRVVQPPASFRCLITPMSSQFNTLQSDTGTLAQRNTLRHHHWQPRHRELL